MSGDLTRAPSPSLNATFIANWMARPVIVPVDRGSILVTALISAALVRCVFRDTYGCIIPSKVISTLKKLSTLPCAREASWAPYLILDTASVVNDTDTCGIGSDIQRLDNLCQEHLYLLKFWRTNTSAAVNDEHDVCGTGLTQPSGCTCRDRKDVIMYSEPKYEAYIKEMSKSRQN